MSSMMGPPAPSGGSGSSNSTSWEGKTAFEEQVLMEPFSDTEMEGTSARSSIPRVGGDEAGPSHQGRDEAGPSHQVVRNASMESSMRNRILRLEQDNSPFLLGKEKGGYWGEIHSKLSNVSSQIEYSWAIEFESKDLMIRESKHECFLLYNRVLAQHPHLRDQAPYNPQEVFEDFLKGEEAKREAQGLPVDERDRQELETLAALKVSLKEQSVDSVRYIFSAEK